MSFQTCLAFFSEHEKRYLKNVHKQIFLEGIGFHCMDKNTEIFLVKSF